MSRTPEKEDRAFKRTRLTRVRGLLLPGADLLQVRGGSKAAQRGFSQGEAAYSVSWAMILWYSKGF